MSQKQSTVYLALPHRGDFSQGTLWGVLFAGGRAKVIPRHSCNSILTLCFNTLWAEALNMRAEHGITHFAMMHSDVGPDMGWVDALVDEQLRTGADILSAVIPIKDGRGLTSTALRNPKTGSLKRLAMREIFDLPVTFDAAGAGYPEHVLLANTGLWVCDFTKPWVEEAYFQQTDCIQKCEDGVFRPSCMPEDWMFSLDAHRRGLDVRATRLVRVKHSGAAEFTNDEPWGSWPFDQEARDRAADDQSLRRTTASSLVRRQALERALKIDGWLAWGEAEVLYDLARQATGPVAEIGSYKGRSTAALALGSADGGRQTVYAIDSFLGVAPSCRETAQGADPAWGAVTPEALRHNLDGAGVNGLVRIVAKDSREAAADVPDGLGLLFVDGAHDYESVAADLDLYLPKVQVGGRVVLHDMPEPGVTRAAAERILGRPERWQVLARVGAALVAGRVS